MSDPSIAFCGLDCTRCDVYLATLRDDPALRQETAAKWSELYGAYLTARLGRGTLAAEEVRCGGCHSETRFLGCGICPVRACCSGRQLGTCAECAEYASCPMLNGFFGVHPEAKERLDGLRAAR